MASLAQAFWRQWSYATNLAVVCVCGCVTQPRVRETAPTDLPMITQSKQCGPSVLLPTDTAQLHIRLSLVPRDSTQQLNATIRIYDRDRILLQTYDHVATSPLFIQQLPREVRIEASQSRYVGGRVAVVLTGGCIHIVTFVLSKMVS